MVKNRKTSTSFVCQECGYDSPKFLGKCPECGMWNSLKEFSTGGSSAGRKSSGLGENIPQKLSSIGTETKDRMSSGFTELDGVLGGGIVAGAAMLLAGDPGIGKSTLLLQIALGLASNQQKPPRAAQKVLYISGEESAQQIKLRADRLGKTQGYENLLLLSITNTDSAIETIENEKPDLVIVDSIQTMESEALTGLAGSVGQVRYAAFEFIKVAKRLQIPTILVGHVTKEGMVAGPMILSHMVDVVLFLEGEKNTGTRVLRSLKNRFGPVDEVGIFTMAGEGMEEVRHPEQLFMDGNQVGTPGSVLVVTLEGTRAFLVELQALVVYSKLPMPRRVASGIDQKRLELLLAVLQKHAQINLSTMDVFVNVAGGLKISDPAVDLGVCLALYASLKNVPLPKTVGIAEVGLLGELRVVPHLEKRVRESEKLGFSTVITAKTHKRLSDVIKSLG